MPRVRALLARRDAVAQLRLSDYDWQRGLMRFREKGSKTIWKPVPDELADTVLRDEAEKTARVRAAELAATDAVNRSILDQIYAIEDAQAAAKAA